MTYSLGVDLGTTYTAAAIARGGRVEVVSLGSNAATVPSVMFVREDDTIVVGEAAARRALTEPTRVVREFKRRFGDPTPIIVAGSPYAPDALMAKLLSWVVDQVSEREGGRPERVALTYPANWGPYKQDLLAQALRLADVGNVATLTEPEAAAISYAATERVEPGAVIAVYDLGGGTFDAAVLRKTDGGFELLGRPEGIEHLGGVDFDEAVFAHVKDACTDAFAGLDASDPGVRAAVAHVRQECTAAKEALSDDTVAAIAVLLSVQTQVRLTRAEFEEMIRPALNPTVAALSRAIVSAGLGTGDVDTILLAGGSSRIPLVGQLIAEQVGRPVAVDVHPKHAVALGAARWAAQLSGDDGVATVTVPSVAPAVEAPAAEPEPEPEPAPALAVAASSPARPVTDPEPVPPPEPEPVRGDGGTPPKFEVAPARRFPARAALAAVGVIAAVGLVGGALAMAGRGNGGGDGSGELAGRADTTAASVATTGAPVADTTPDASEMAARQKSEADVQRRLNLFFNVEISYFYAHGGRWATTDAEIGESLDRAFEGRNDGLTPISTVAESAVPILPSSAVAVQVRGKTLHAASVAEGGACFYKRFTPGDNAPGNEYAIFRPDTRATRGRPRGQIAPATQCPNLLDAAYTTDMNVWASR